jgi:uncharacterized protein (DUF1810 family)
MADQRVDMDRAEAAAGPIGALSGAALEAAGARVAAPSFDLRRFVDVQTPVMEQVRAELAAGRKASHWMWFVFPQIAGLGSSAMARRYGIGSREEALAYLAHPVLGPRLRVATALVNAAHGRTAREIFGSPDDLKFRSSMTLFAEAAGDATVFEEALDKYFGGARDPKTLDRLD